LARVANVIDELKTKCSAPTKIECFCWNLVGVLCFLDFGAKAEFVDLKGFASSSKTSLRMAINSTQQVSKVISELEMNQFFQENADLFPSVKELIGRIKNEEKTVSTDLIVLWAFLSAYETMAIIRGAPSDPNDRNKLFYVTIEYAVQRLSRLCDLRMKTVCKYIARLGYEVGLFDGRKIKAKIKSDEEFLSDNELARRVISNITATIVTSINRLPER